MGSGCARWPHDAAGAALDTSFIAEDDMSVRHGCVAICRAAVDALLALALEARFRIDDFDVRPPTFDVVVIEREFPLNCRRIENAGAEIDGHSATCSVDERTPESGQSDLSV